MYYSTRLSSVDQLNLAGLSVPLIVALGDGNLRIVVRFRGQRCVHFGVSRAIHAREIVIVWQLTSALCKQHILVVDL